jgi:hypothetical protein
MFAYSISQDLSLALLEPRHAEELFRLTDANREHLREWLPWIDGVRAVEVYGTVVHEWRTARAAARASHCAWAARTPKASIVITHPGSPAFGGWRKREAFVAEVALIELGDEFRAKPVRARVSANE